MASTRAGTVRVVLGITLVFVFLAISIFLPLFSGSWPRNNQILFEELGGITLRFLGGFISPLGSILGAVVSSNAASDVSSDAAIAATVAGSHAADAVAAAEKASRQRKGHVFDDVEKAFKKHKISLKEAVAVLQLKEQLRSAGMTWEHVKAQQDNTPFLQDHGVLKERIDQLMTRPSEDPWDPILTLIAKVRKCKPETIIQAIDKGGRSLAILGNKLYQIYGVVGISITIVLAAFVWLCQRLLKPMIEEQDKSETEIAKKLPQLVHDKEVYKAVFPPLQRSSLWLASARAMRDLVFVLGFRLMMELAEEDQEPELRALYSRTSSISEALDKGCSFYIQTAPIIKNGNSSLCKVAVDLWISLFRSSTHQENALKDIRDTKSEPASTDEELAPLSVTSRYGGCDRVGEYQEPQVRSLYSRTAPIRATFGKISSWATQVSLSIKSSAWRIGRVSRELGYLANLVRDMADTDENARAREGDADGYGGCDIHRADEEEPDVQVRGTGNWLWRTIGTLDYQDVMQHHRPGYWDV